MTKPNKNHKAIIEGIRALLAEPTCPPSVKKITKLSNDELIEKVFAKRVKHKAHDGQVLSNFGTTLLKHCFNHWSVDISKPLTARQHLIMARACRLPYYIGETYIVVFESSIGVLLKLCEGNIEAIETMFPE